MNYTLRCILHYLRNDNCKWSTPGRRFLVKLAMVNMKLSSFWLWLWLTLVLHNDSLQLAIAAEAPFSSPSPPSLSPFTPSSTQGASFSSWRARDSHVYGSCLFSTFSFSCRRHRRSSSFVVTLMLVFLCIARILPSTSPMSKPTHTIQIFGYPEASCSRCCMSLIKRWIFGYPLTKHLGWSNEGTWSRLEREREKREEK